MNGTTYIESNKYPNDSSIKEKFLKIKNTVTNSVRETKQKYFDKTFSDCLGNNRKTWKHINELLYNRPSKHRENITKIISNNKSLENNVDICNAFSNYFSEIPTKLAEELNRQNRQKKNANMLTFNPEFNSVIICR